MLLTQRLGHITIWGWLDTKRFDIYPSLFMIASMGLIGIDTGGTFTDLVFQDGDSWRVYKILSTPDNPADAVIEGLKAVALTGPHYIVHGSTVATNAILERKGARTALITNQGFTDVLVIGRQNRSRLYDLTYRHEPPLIPESLRFGVGGRMVHTGDELTPFDVSKAMQVADTIHESGVESVAVSFLFSFVNPAHELKMAEILAPLGISTSLSYQILAEFREFERTSTTVVNAYVRPRMKHYLSDISERLEFGDRLRIMQSNGGCISADTAVAEPVRTILSGPAGGVVGAFEVGRRAGFDRLITFDMGGTSTDVSLINGRPPLTLESSIAGFPVKNAHDRYPYRGRGRRLHSRSGPGWIVIRRAGKRGRRPGSGVLRQRRQDHGHGRQSVFRPVDPGIFFRRSNETAP